MMHIIRTRHIIRSQRRGTATVEFAVIAIFLMTLMLGVIEVTRAIQVNHDDPGEWQERGRFNGGKGGSSLRQDLRVHCCRQLGHAFVHLQRHG